MKEKTWDIIDKIEERLKNMIINNTIINQTDKIRINDFSGIYFLFDKDELVYIGSSKNIPSRVGIHLNNGVEFDSYNYISVADKLLRKKIEMKAIQHYNPKYNYMLKNPELR